MKYLSPAEYLPHDAPMMLLETVESVTDNGAACSVTVSGHGVLAPFLNADGDLPGWFALELMAQTVGVWCEWHRLQKGCRTARWAWCWARVNWYAPEGCLPQAPR